MMLSTKSCLKLAISQLRALLFVVLFYQWLLVGPASGQGFLDPNNPVAETNFGRVRGISVDIGNSRSAISFIGIPFAAAPTRGNRFREPQPASPWSGEFDATRNRRSCLQGDQRFQQSNNLVNIMEDEDCLYLNVFVPSARSAIAQRLPVIVYFHGGEFKYGGKDYYKPNILLQQDVILVVPNYRLGVLGFLGTDDDHSPGNYGLRDQIAALRWVKSEIQRFGGDPNVVTIFGHDAGAISVSALMLAPAARGLFNRSISSGGTVFTPWAFQEDPYLQARNFGRELNCNTDGRRLMRCLREKSASKLVALSRAKGYFFRPVIDKNTSYPLIKDYPYRLFENNDFAKVPYLCGLTKQEGALDYYRRYGSLNRDAKTRDTLELLISPYLRRYANGLLIAAAVDYQYFQRFNQTGGRNLYQPLGYPNGQQNYQQRAQGTIINKDDTFADVMGDFLYNAPTDLALKMHSRSGQSTFLYVLSYVGSKSFGPLQKDASREIRRDSYGVTHMDDSLYVLPNEYDPSELDQSSKNVATALARCIYFFANPNAPAYAGGCAFKPYTQYEQNLLNFGQYANPVAEVRFRKSEDLAFWNDLVSRMIEFTATPPPYFPYKEYSGFQAATWSMLAFVLILLLVVVGLAAVLCINKRNEKRSLTLLRARDQEFEERYNRENGGALETERL